MKCKWRLQSPSECQLKGPNIPAAWNIWPSCLVLSTVANLSSGSQDVCRPDHCIYEKTMRTVSAQLGPLQSSPAQLLQIELMPPPMFKSNDGSTSSECFLNPKDMQQIISPSQVLQTLAAFNGRLYHCEHLSTASAATTCCCLLWAKHAVSICCSLALQVLHAQLALNMEYRCNAVVTSNGCQMARLYLFANDKKSCLALL